MKLLENTRDLQAYIQWCKDHDKTIGFVPTMGALHDGHMSLVELSKQENDITIVSIYVNPTQFNNPEDLEKYPRTLEKDADLLQKVGCNAVFAPSTSEVYPDEYLPKVVDLGILDSTMEGEHRPGHFLGVVNVVQRFFDLVQPHKAYFGRKDFQQVAVIKTMVQELKYPLTIITGDTVREESGLALSSRNALLSLKEKQEAIQISKTLFQMKELAKNNTPNECAAFAKKSFKTGNLKLEYLQIVHPLTFEELTDTWTSGATVCVVAYCGNVRLIDNLELISEKVQTIHLSK